MTTLLSAFPLQVPTQTVSKAVVTADYLDGITLQVSGSHLVVNDTTKVPLSSKGVAGGVAPIGLDGRIPSSYLPASIDSIVEYPNLASFPLVGISGVIYVALDSGITYRWSGSIYTALNPSPGSTDAIPEGLVNLYYTNARARGAISVSGNLTYNGATGVISGPNLSTYVTSSSLATTLGSYVTSSSLATTLGGYVTTATLSSSLSGYVTNSVLSSTLSGYTPLASMSAYVTSATLSFTLSNYVTNSALSSAISSAMSSYVTSASLTSILASYATTSALSSYVTTATLSSTLGSYALSSSLGSYVTSSALSSTLSNYVTTSSLSGYGVGAGIFNSQQFSGNGSQTAFTLSVTPSGINNTQVYVNGIYQEKTTYTLTGAVITFSEAPLAGTNNIEVVVVSSVSLGVTSSDLVSQQAADTGATTRTVQAKLRETVSVKDYGAVGNGTTDDTAAIQAAVNTGRDVYLPAGTYYITNKLTFSTRGQHIKGDGQRLTSLKITPSFNLSATAVFGVSNIEVEFRDLWMKFTQPDTNNRASLTNYPVAINCAGIGGALHIRDVSITCASNGIDMTGNCGQTIIENLYMSAFGTGISIDGALDTVRISGYHFWPYEMTGNNQAIFFTNPTRAFSIGRVDGLLISKFLNISNLGLYTFMGATGRPWIYITESGFDSFNGIQCTAGSIQMSNSYITLSDGAGWYAIQQSGTGSSIQIDNCLFFLGPSTGVPAIKMQSSSDMKMTVSNSFIDNYVNGGYVFHLDSSATNSLLSVSQTTFNVGSAAGYFATATGGLGNKLHLHNNYLATTPNTAYGLPMVNVSTSVRSYLAGNRINDKGANAATFINVQTADYHMVTTNMAPGWTYSLPTGTGFYGNNI